MVLHVCCLLDKIDGFTDKGNFIVDRSLREICRQYRNLFARNQQLIPAEWQLYHVADIDEQSLISVPFDKPVLVDVNSVLGSVNSPAGTEVVD